MNLRALLTIISCIVVNAQEKAFDTPWDYESFTDPETTSRLRRTAPPASAVSEFIIPALEPISSEEVTDSNQKERNRVEPSRQQWEYGTDVPQSNIPRLNNPRKPAKLSEMPSPQFSRHQWEYYTDAQSNTMSLTKTRDLSILFETPSSDESATHLTAIVSTKKSSNDAPNQHPDSSEKKKPNILLILADDVGTGDIPSYWDSGMVEMPNIQKIADNGVTFLRAHATPLCAPSRYMLLSGNYQHRGREANGSWNLGYDNNQFQSYQISIAEVLKGAGYETMMAGKWHLGAKVPPLGLVNPNKYLTDPRHNWKMPLIDGPPDIGFDYSMITTGGIQDAPYSFFRNGLLTTNISSEAQYWERGSYNTSIGESVIRKAGEGDISWDSSSYNMKLVNETSAFIGRHLKEREKDPFFAYVALGAVHYPHSPPKHYLNGEKIAGQYPNHHLDMLLEMDYVVGSLLTMIEERNLMNDTIIIFASDNGGLKRDFNVPHRSSGPLKDKKAQIWEGGHRVPLMMRYDGTFPANEKRGNLVGLNDIYATICDFLDIDIPSRSAQDSISFVDQIFSASKTENHRDSLAIFDYKKGMLEADSLLKGNLKLIRFYETYSSVHSHVELYDLGTDISETNDLSREPRFASVIDDMLLELKALGPCPDDVSGKFPIYNKKFDRTFNANCRFFKRKPWRCNKFIEGWLNCISTCGVRHKKVCNPEKR